MGSITIRLPDEMLDTIRAMADRDHRSVNGEIAWLLEQALTQQGRS